MEIQVERPTYFTPTTGVRLTLTLFLLIRVYMETGPWTAITLGMMSMALEAHTHGLKMLAFGKLVMLDHHLEDLERLRDKL